KFPRLPHPRIIETLDMGFSKLCSNCFSKNLGIRVKFVKLNLNISALLNVSRFYETRQYLKLRAFCVKTYQIGFNYVSFKKFGCIYNISNYRNGFSVNRVRRKLRLILSAAKQAAVLTLASNGSISIFMRQSYIMQRHFRIVFESKNACMIKILYWFYYVNKTIISFYNIVRKRSSISTNIYHDTVFIKRIVFRIFVVGILPPINLP